MFYFVNILIFINFFDKNNIFNYSLLFNNMKFNFELMFENKSMIFLIILMLIVISIYFFKKYYMDMETNNKYFSFLFYWFVISMMIIIYCQNWLLMILGWDMLGVSSYLLIIFYNNYSSTNSGYMTMNTNRLGDIFLISFFAILMNKNMTNFNEKKNFILFMMILCLLTKSAQFPFSSWLPLAMAAPTPVSSLVHSSTLVTAGLFIFYKNDFIFNKITFSIVFILSIWTNFYSGLMASMEMDMKKMIALSTLSQLSFMFISLSLGMIFLSFLHLLTHAIFKASLFFWAGMSMHTMKSEQLFVSFNQKNNKLSQCFFYLIMLSLLGMPFSLGFFSKDQMIDMEIKNMNMFMNLIFIMSIYLTLIYTIRFMKKMTSMNFNKVILKSLYFNLKNINKSILIFSFLMLTNSYINSHWFKITFLLLSKGWKMFFLILMILLMMINWLKTTIKKKMLTSKMFFLNLFSVKILKIENMKKNIKNIYFDFGWMNMLSNKTIINLLNMSFMIIMNLKNQMKILLLVLFFLMNSIL